MTNLDLDELRKLCDATTPGDWHSGDCVQPRIVLYAVPKHRPLLTDDTLTIGHTYCDSAGQGRANMRFIAAAHQIIPALIAEVERLRARRDELLAAMVRVTNETPFPDEAKDALAQRGKLLAEIGTLRAERDEARRLVLDYIGAPYGSESSEAHSALTSAARRWKESAHG